VISLDLRPMFKNSFMCFPPPGGGTETHKRDRKKKEVPQMNRVYYPLHLISQYFLCCSIQRGSMLFSFCHPTNKCGLLSLHSLLWHEVTRPSSDNIDEYVKQERKVSKTRWSYLPETKEMRRQGVTERRQGVGGCKTPFPPFLSIHLCILLLFCSMHS
jgi:hypothetical protein